MRVELIGVVASMVEATTYMTRNHPCAKAEGAVAFDEVHLQVIRQRLYVRYQRCDVNKFRE